jgi:hypothetical protein
VKIRPYLILLSILFSGALFGQEVFFGEKTDSTFVKYQEKVHLLDRLILAVEPIRPTDTISLTNAKGKVEKYKLKYIDRKGNPPSFEDFLKTGSKIMFSDSSYSCIKFGSDFIVIQMSRNTGMINDIKYYYESL